MKDTSSNKVGLVGLIGVVISAMVGGGAYNLPQNLAEFASAPAQLLAWAITGAAAWCIASTFRMLSVERPALKDGIYSYAYAGFGPVVGFFSAFAYWIRNIIQMVAYAVLVISTLDYFLPALFEQGTSWSSIAISSLILWFMAALMLKGTKSSAMLNVVVTAAKLIPLFFFLVVMLFVFSAATFGEAFVAPPSNPLPIAAQVSDCFPITFFAFVGIESAVIISGNARSQKDVAKATGLGFVFVFILYVLISILPFAHYSQEELAGLASPSVAAILGDTVGAHAAVLVNIGVVVSVLGAWLVAMLMLIQMPLFASRDELFPSCFKATNTHGAPYVSILVSTVIAQVILVGTRFLGSGLWTVLISVSSVMAMPCYLLCSAFLFKAASEGKEWEAREHSRTAALITGGIGTILTAMLIVGSGFTLISIACVFYAAGMVFLVITQCLKREKGLRFTISQKGVIVLFMVMGILGLFYLIVPSIMAG